MLCCFLLSPFSPFLPFWKGGIRNKRKNKKLGLDQIRFGYLAAFFFSWITCLKQKQKKQRGQGQALGKNEIRTHDFLRSNRFQDDRNKPDSTIFP